MNVQNPDATLGVEFFVKAVENPRKSKAEGRPIFEDREYVRIRFPGDNKKEHVAPASEIHYAPGHRRQMTYADRFHEVYDAFQKGRADFVSGTPLAQVAFLTEAQRAELKSQHIVTVEQLAGLQDRIIGRLGMGWREKVTAAQDFMQKASGAAEVDALREELAALKAQLSTGSSGDATDTERQFADFERDDLFVMAQEANLNPRANATKESLVKLLAEHSDKKAKEAA